MRYLFLLLLLAGCTTSTAALPERTDVERLAFAADLERLTIINESTSEAAQQQVALLTSIRDEVAKINAEPLPPEPAKEVIPADDRPEICITYADFHCPPCERLKTAVADGKFDAFRVRETPDFDGLKGYPAIRYESPAGSGKWVQVNGFDSGTIARLTAKLLPNKAPAEMMAVTQTQREMDSAEHLRNTHGINPDGMTLAEMEAAHDAAHGGSGYHFPGYSSLSTWSADRSYFSNTVRNCPSCPTGSNYKGILNSSTGVRYGLFGRRRR